MTEQLLGEKREHMKEEALKRLAILNILPDVCMRLKRNDALYYSERINRYIPAVLYWLDDRIEWKMKVQEIEEKYGIFVYHAVLSHMEFGDMLDFLYVSDEEETWEEEREDLKLGYARIYAWNLWDEWCSEFGSAQYKSVMGGLCRLC